jgi:hypothetical protein
MAAPLLFQNSATGQRAHLCFGPLPEATTPPLVAPLVQLSPPEPDNFFAEYQFAPAADDAQRDAIHDYAQKLIAYNPLVSVVSPAHHLASGDIVVAVGVASLEWDVVADPPGSITAPEPPAELRVVKFPYLLRGIERS